MLKLFKRYKDDDKGILAVDFMMSLPLLLLWIFASITVFDGFVKYNKMVKATATVTNLISRLEVTSNEELSNIYWLFREIAVAKEENSGMRVTSVKQESGVPTIHWSHPLGNVSAMSDGDSALSSVPPLVDGDYIMLLETRLNYEPLIDWDFFPSTTFRIDQPFVLRFTGKLENTDIDTGLTDDQSDGSDESGTDPQGS